MPSSIDGEIRLVRRMQPLIGIGLAVTLLPLAAACAGDAPRPHATVQRLRPAPARSLATLKSEHFDLVYDAAKVTEEQAREAARVSEAAWSRCRELFRGAPDHRLKIDLTPDFTGATGFFRPGDPNAKDADERPFIGVRYSELDYLGLPPEYVLTHEIGHWFSGPLAGSGLGEGIADWAAGGFAGVPMQPWWGRALEESGLWIEPEGLFITGEFPSNPEVDAQNRTATYAETALLLRYLTDRFGWEKVRDFATDYNRARGRLDSNDLRRRLRLVPRPRGREAPPPPAADRRDPRLPPDPNAVRSTFEKQFGQPWSTLATGWQTWYRSEPPPAAPRERLILAYRIYGAIRNYEMWLLQQRPAPATDAQRAVRSAFIQANRHLKEGRLAEARAAFQEARALVEQLREPRLIAAG